MGKILYDENGNKISFNGETLSKGFLGEVYKLDDNTCLKYISNSLTDIDVIKEIVSLDLESFYKIYQIFYNRFGEIGGYTMKYYREEKIDILALPVEYALDNFSKIIKDSKKLTDKYIVMGDLHPGNVIMDKNNITVIDADNYYFTKDSVSYANSKWLLRLFEGLFTEALENYHIATYDNYRIIHNIFGQDLDRMFTELSNYKYPIDYIKKKSLEPVKYVMKKGM